MNINIEINENERGNDDLAKIIVKIPDYNTETTLALPFGEIYASYGAPDATSLDLLLVASICYVIDKSVPRKDSFDSWTRNFKVEFPVAEVEKWNNASEKLIKAVNFLTGDIWDLSFRKRNEIVFKTPPSKIRRKPLPKVEKAEAVCSFSGGVDSLIGAINLLESKKFTGIQLIGHYDAPGAKSAQKLLLNQVKAAYSSKADLLQVRVSQKSGKKRVSGILCKSEFIN